MTKAMLLYIHHLAVAFEDDLSVCTSATKFLSDHAKGINLITNSYVLQPSFTQESTSPHVHLLDCIHR